MIGIVVVDKGFGIGKSNGLLFRLPLDMKRFRSITSGHTVIVGANTLASFPEGKALPNRNNIVLTDRPLPVQPNLTQVNGLPQLFEAIDGLQPDEVFVCGGARVYSALMPYCDKFFVTKVDEYGGAEVFLDDLDVSPDFTLSEQTEPIDDNGHSTTYCVYVNNHVRKFNR